MQTDPQPDTSGAPRADSTSAAFIPASLFAPKRGYQTSPRSALRALRPAVPGGTVFLCAPQRSSACPACPACPACSACSCLPLPFPVNRALLAAEALLAVKFHNALEGIQSRRMSAASGAKHRGSLPQKKVDRGLAFL